MVVDSYDEQAATEEGTQNYADEFGEAHYESETTAENEYAGNSQEQTSPLSLFSVV